jgi:predicted membrane metal-binding protein
LKLLQLLMSVLLELPLLRLLIMCPLLLPLLLQQKTLLALFLLFLILLFPPLLSLLLVLPLLPFLNGMEPNGPWCLSLDLRALYPLVRDMSICRAWAILGLITNSDGVAHSPQLGWLGGSLLTLGARRLALSGG